MKKNVIIWVWIGVVVFMGACKPQKQNVEWIESTEPAPWVVRDSLFAEKSGNPISGEMAVVFTDSTLQVIQGFGACFNELGWDALSLLSNNDRAAVMSELFEPGKGGNFTLCRMPVGANDFSRDWYSYDETNDDFEMTHFSIANDTNTLIPFILNAKKYNPDLKIWASPWSPPLWMKHNRHYACRPLPGINDLPGDPNTNLEGTNMFITRPEYYQAYALYFGKFIDAYKTAGIDIFAVAPQNEFNSCQCFPSCTWLSSALADFVGNYLGPEMQKREVQVMFGTMERPDARMADTVLQHPRAGKYISIAGFQWAGKEAIAAVHNKYPQLTLYQTEQECGDGKNTWSAAIYSWNLMKHYLSNGANVYEYWNLALKEGGKSRWGWKQNSLVVVDTLTQKYHYTPEYHVFKHITNKVQPGAKRLQTSGYEDLLAFKNPDGSVVIVTGNFDNTDKPITIRVNDKQICPVLTAGSLNTLVIK